MEKGRMRSKMSVCIMVLLLLGCTLDVSAAKANKKKRNEPFTAAKAIAAIDSIYAADSLAKTLVYYTASVQSMRKILARIDTTAIDTIGTEPIKARSKVYKHYQNSYFAAQDLKDWPQMEKQATILTMLGDTTDVGFQIHEALINLYDYLDNPNRVRFFFRRYAERIKLTNEAAVEHLAQLEKDYDDIIHVHTFEDVARGMYVSTETDKHGLPLFMIKLEGRVPPGIIRSPEMPEPLVVKNNGLYTLTQPRMPDCRLLLFDEPAEELLFGFDNLRFHDGNPFLAQTFENLGTSVNTSIQDALERMPIKSAEDFGRDVGLRFAGALFEAGMMAAAEKAAESVGKYNRYTFDLHATSPYTYDATYGHFYERYTSSSQWRKDTRDCNLTLVKWEPEDGVFFCHKKKYHPMTLSPINKEDNMLNDEDYQNLKKKLKAYKITSNTATFFMCAAVLSMGIARATKSENSNSNTDTMFLGIGLGAFACAIGVGVPSMNIDSKLHKLRRCINEKNLNRLKSKADAATLSISPFANPVNNNGGVSINITY